MKLRLQQQKGCQVQLAVLESAAVTIPGIVLEKLARTSTFLCLEVKPGPPNWGLLHCMYGSSGCVGGFARPPPMTAPEKSGPKKSLGSKRHVQGHTARPRDWWTSSSNDMDSNGMLNAHSFQNFPISTHSLHINNSSNSTYSNHGLMLWNEQREEWVGNRPRPQSEVSRESVISGSTTYEDLLGTSRPFPQPVHLPEMVEFLVDVWEQEGLYEI